MLNTIYLTSNKYKSLERTEFMYNCKKKEEILDAFTKAARENAERNLSDLNIEAFMESGNTDVLREAISKVQANITSAMPEGIPIPKASLYTSPISTDGKTISIINLSVTNKVKGSKKFKFAHVIKKEHAKDTLIDVFLAVYTELLVDYLGEQNLIHVNEVLQEATKEAGLSYEIKVVTSLGNEGKKVSYLGDDAVIFVADEERLFDLEDTLALQEVSEFVTEEFITAAKKQLVDDLAGAQTTVQLIALHGGLLVSSLLDINKRVKPMTIIKKVTNRNVENLNGNKDAIAYYAKENVFSIVAKREDGFEVLLSPFDIETLRKVDVDVIAEISKIAK